MPTLPAVPGDTRLTTAEGSGLADRTAAVFGPGGALARALPTFEPRESQVEMALAVARLLDAGGVLLAEAGTGTGKTLAYLVPAILSRQRVLVSTGTKNLQEQIFFKDIPFLQQALDIPFTAACMKGRANYLCLHRLDQLTGQGAGAMLAPGADVFLPIVKQWAAETESGDRAELEDLPEDLPFWNDVSASAETCLGAECPRYDECFITRMRQQAAAADVVIVNHHLLCADAAVRQNAYGEVIPACSHAIIDEAHQLEDVATQYFGFGVSSYRVDDFAHDVERLLRTGAVANDRRRDEIDRALERLRDAARSFFTELAFAHRGRAGGRVAGARTEDRVRATPTTLSEIGDAAALVTGALDLVEAALAGAIPAAVASDDGAPARSEELSALALRARTMKEELRQLVRADDPAFVYFVEFRGRGIFLRASPIDVSTFVRELVIDRARAAVLTSATLTVDGTFEYVRERLGLAGADELRLASEFDYETQAVLYLPRRMPDPRSGDFVSAAGRQIVEMLKRTQGRAFVLFTSYATMRAVQGIAELALDFPILVQGSAPRSQLLRQFRDTPHAVLLATSSFWQGVDVVGPALSCVIIDKLPFAPPADPVTAARIDSVRSKGGEPFADYQVPLAILALQQGLGRLIRHRRDRGVLAVLDPRLRTMPYGRRFLASLPPAPVVDDLDAVDRFFERATTAGSR